MWLRACIIIGSDLQAGWARQIVERDTVRSRRADPTLTKFFEGLVKYAVIAFVVIAALAAVRC